MTLSQTQQTILDRARVGNVVLLPRDQATAKENSPYGSRICNLRGSGEHRTARALEDKGFGKIFPIQPLEQWFFVRTVDITYHNTPHLNNALDLVSDRQDHYKHLTGTDYYPSRFF